MNHPVDRQRKALGKGLSALLPARAAAPAPAPEPAKPTQSGVTTVPLAEIDPNPMQPRTVFQPERLEELAASIRSSGIIQPLIVRRHGARYQIVAGERRWRAAKMAGLNEVPVVVQEVAEPVMLELALIENIQREDLNPIETAHAFERLQRDLHLSHEELGRRTGKDRTTITNLLRLLKLPIEVQQLLADHRITQGHARALLALPDAQDQVRLAEKTAAQGLSVRQVEAQVQELTADPRRTGGTGARRESAQDPNVRAAADKLQSVLGTRVRIVELSDQRGRIEIEYYSQEELDRLFQQIASVG
jgi:ParB family chromosome partitioning protein